MYVQSIVTYIDGIIRSNLQGANYSQSRYYGIAKKAIRDQDGQQFQVIFDNSGNDISAQIDDTYSLSVYHRCLSFTFSSALENQKNSFGDAAKIKDFAAEMVMVVYGDRARVQTTNEELSVLMYCAFPSELSAANIALLTGIRQLIISPIATNNISQGAGSVEDQEGLHVHPENILFSIRYKINFSINTDCVNCISTTQWTDCLQSLRTCSPVVIGTQFLSFFTEINTNAYSVPSLLSKQIMFVQMDNIPLRPDQYNLSGTTFTITDTTFPVDAGQFINIAFQ